MTSVTPSWLEEEVYVIDFQQKTTQYISQDHLTYVILIYFGTIGKSIISTPGNALTYFYFQKKKVRYTHTHTKKYAVDDTNSFHLQSVEDLKFLISSFGPNPIQHCGSWC